MALAIVIAVAGLASPYVIRAGISSGAAPRLVIAGHLTGLLLAWAGILATVAELVAPGAGIVVA
ncbi:MAG: hypothetical protein GEV09_28645, partial [Pseudonocardiaceae bacterium]|nr:hypothetical protein [Pseudonocardiaceae bacterium]